MQEKISFLSYIRTFKINAIKFKSSFFISLFWFGCSQEGSNLPDFLYSQQQVLSVVWRS